MRALVVGVVSLGLATSALAQDQAQSPNGVATVRVDLTQLQRGDVDALRQAYAVIDGNTAELSIDIAAVLCAVSAGALMAMPEPRGCVAKIEGIDTLMMIQ